MDHVPSSIPSSASPRLSSSRQRGVVLVIALITLVVLLVGAVALVRSFGTSLTISGQTAFKRDLMNQGEVGIAAAKTALTNGAANSDILRENNQLAANYFATLRANNDTADGIPRDLINDDNFTGTAADVQGNGVTIRYVIERQCANAGPFDASTCSVFPKPAASSGGERRELVGAEYAPIYRITVRVQGPRNTTAFLQSLITI